MVPNAKASPNHFPDSSAIPLTRMIALSSRAHEENVTEFRALLRRQAGWPPTMGFRSERVFPSTAESIEPSFHGRRRCPDPAGDFAYPVPLCKKPSRKSSPCFQCRCATRWSHRRHIGSGGPVPLGKSELCSIRGRISLINLGGDIEKPSKTGVCRSNTSRGQSDPAS